MSETVPDNLSYVPQIARIHDFEIRAQFSRGSRATLQLRGELDLCSADLFSAVLQHHIAAGRRFVRLDLSDVSFIDCTGLRAIVEAHNSLVGCDGSLVLTRVGRRTARLLRITKLDTALRIDRTPTTPRIGRVVTAM